MRVPHSRDTGFSLMEVIVALVIASGCMSAFYLAMGGAYRAESKVRLYASAIGQARSQIDGAGALTPLEPGTTAGRYPNGANWRMTVTALDNGPAADTPQRAPAYWISLDVFDPRGRPLFGLQTAKVTELP